MPEYLMAKLINLIKFRDEKIKVEYVNIYNLC